MNRKPKRSPVFDGRGPCAMLAALLVALLSCNFLTSKIPQAAGTGVPGTLATWAAQTLQVRRTSTAAALELATATPPPANPTSSLPLISASVNTNCRQGPNIIYDRVGYLLAGKQSTVHGRNEEHTWWYIANPTRDGEYCWVWNQTTTVAGDLTGLSVVAPPALVEPGFEAEYAGLKRCYGNNLIVLQVQNTGDDTFFQASVTIHTQKGHQVLLSHILSKPYLSNASDCPPGRNHLPAGSTAYIAIDKNYVNSRHPERNWEIPYDKDLRATLILCTSPDEERKCVERKVEFQVKK